MEGKVMAQYKRKDLAVGDAATTTDFYLSLFLLFETKFITYFPINENNFNLL